MKSTRLLVLPLIFLFSFGTVSASIPSVSNIENADTLSDAFLCSSAQSGNYKGYQYLGTGFSGELSRVDLKVSFLPPIYYGKFLKVSVYESDTYLDNFDAVIASREVWHQGRKPSRAGNITGFDGVISFDTPLFGLDYNFLPTKHYYLVPTYYTFDADGICQGSYMYGSTDPDAFPYGEYFSDSKIKDLYFKLYELTQEPIPPQPTGNSNVLFIPGLEASRLYKPLSGGGETQLWEPGGNADAVQLVSQPDGTSVNPDIYTKDIIDETNRPVPLLGFLGQNIYKSFSTMMDGLVSSDKIVAWQAYAYDWRQDVQDIVDNGTKRDNGVYKLTDALTSLASASKSGKVTIIAHSEGGLLAKALLKKLEDDKTAGRNNLIDKIDTVILVTTPQWGTPSTIPSILHGYDQGIALNILLNPMTARELARNMPGVYGLLASAEYFNHVGTPVISFVPNVFDPYMSNDIAKYGPSISTYSATKDFMIGGDGRSNPFSSDTLKPIVANPLLLTQAETLHSSIDTMTVPENIRVIQIAGWGLDTIAGFQYNASSTCSSRIDDGCTGNYILDERPIFTSDGDRVVVTPSALAMSREKYWVDLPEHNAELGKFRRNREHKDIFEVNQLNNFLSSIISSTTPVYDLVLTNAQPIDTKNHLRLSVHSPVTLDVYDINGNHTGKVCPAITDLCYTEENIPNSSYYEFGEGKYLNLLTDDLQKVVLQGTDVGTFTFDSEVVTPDGQTITSSFIDIPVITQTQAEVTVDITGTAQLKLDITGDGVVDFTLAPTTDFNPITYLEIMKATVYSLDLTQAKKNTFNNRVDNIIKSIQKGKIDKAKLKADRFKIVLEKKLTKPDPKKSKPNKLSKTDAQLLLDMLDQLLDNLG